MFLIHHLDELLATQFNSELKQYVIKENIKKRSHSYAHIVSKLFVFKSFVLAVMAVFEFLNYLEGKHY